VVGATGLVVNLLLLTGFLAANVPESISIGLAIALSMAWGFILNRRFSLLVRPAGQLLLRQLVGFVAASSTGAFVSYFTTLALWNVFHVKQFAAVIGVAAGTALDLLGSRFIVFRKEHVRTDDEASCRRTLSRFPVVPSNRPAARRLPCQVVDDGPGRVPRWARPTSGGCEPTSRYEEMGVSSGLGTAWETSLMGLSGLACDGASSLRPVASPNHRGQPPTSVGPTGPVGTSLAVTLSPASARVATGSVQLFTASVTGTTDGSVIWSVQEGAAGGRSTPPVCTGLPAQTGVFHVMATSHADARVSQVAQVAVFVPDGDLRERDAGNALGDRCVRERRPLGDGVGRLQGA